ncbi:MAG: DMT family transporter [Deltaproteobacteria bacterium]|nr:DMT family transporter [Deltaproteobacteria bacterium]
MKKIITSGYGLVIFSALGFSFKSILAKLAFTYGTDAMTLMLMRIYVSLPFFLVTLWYLEGKDGFRVSLKDAVFYSVAGIGGLGCAMFFSLYSLESITASLSTLLVFTYPAMTVILGLFISGRQVRAGRWISLMITFAGLALVVNPDKKMMTGMESAGIYLALASALCYAFYNLYSEKALKRVSPAKLTACSMVFFVVFFGALFGNRTYPGPGPVWTIAFIMGVTSGFLPFLCYMYGVKKIGASRAVIISSMGPLFTVLWASIFLGERLGYMQLAGMVLIISGVMSIKIRSPFSFVKGTAGEIGSHFESLSEGKQKGKGVFAFVYVTKEKN